MPGQVIRGFPPGIVPERVPLPRRRMAPENQIVYSPVFQRPLMAQYREYPYVINTDTYPMVLNPLATLTSQFTIDGDNDFFLETLRCVLQTSTGLLFTIQITDTRSGASLFSSPTHISAVINPGGTIFSGGLPGYLSQLDWLVSPAGSRASLAVSLTDLSNATNTIWLSVAGRRQLVNPGMPRTQLQQ